MAPYRRRRLLRLARRMIQSELGLDRRTTSRILRAHRLLNRGRPARAAGLFSEATNALERMGRPAPPMLYIEAGRAQLQAGQPDLAGASYERGLQVLIDDGRADRLQSLGRLAIAELETAGFDQLPAQLGRKVEQAIQAAGTSTIAPLAERAARLPAKCPYCGGSVRSTEVDWLTPEEPACAYCGSPLGWAG